MTQGKFQRNRSRHFDFFRDPGHQGNANSGDPGIFDSSLNQSHGLMADGSARGQKSDVDLGLLEFLSHLLGCPFSEGSRIGDEAHEPVIHLRKSTDNIFILQLPQAVDGENAVDVPVGIGMVIMSMGDH